MRQLVWKNIEPLENFLIFSLKPKSCTMDGASNTNGKSGTGGTDLHTCLNTGIPLTIEKGTETQTQKTKPSLKKDEHLRVTSATNYQQELIGR